MWRGHRGAAPGVIANRRTPELIFGEWVTDRRGGPDILARRHDLHPGAVVAETSGALRVSENFTILFHAIAVRIYPEVISKW